MDHWLQTGYMSENHCKKRILVLKGLKAILQDLWLKEDSEIAGKVPAETSCHILYFWIENIQRRAAQVGTIAVVLIMGWVLKCFFWESAEKKKKVSSFTCECYLLQERIIVFLLLHISRRHLEALPCPFHCAVAVGILTHSLHLF